jgi:hypothetical protein
VQWLREYGEEERWSDMRADYLLMEAAMFIERGAHRVSGGT